MPASMRKRLFGSLAIGSVASLALVAGVGCGSESSGDAEDGANAFSSGQATAKTFEFNGEVVAAAGVNVRAAVKSQLLYTVGILNAERSAANLGNLAFDDKPTTE